MKPSSVHDTETSNPAPGGMGSLAPLCDLPPGSGGVVDQVDVAAAAGRRLIDLGFVPGTAVTVVRRAPLGEPVEYELRGTRICLRRSEAERVRIRIQ